MALNFGPPVMNFEALGSLGKTFQDAQAAAQKRLVDDQRRQLLASLGQGSGDFQKAGLGLIGAGDVQSGVALLGLAQKDKERQAEQEWVRQNSGSPASPTAPGAPVAAIGNPNEVESRFIGGVKQAGLVNPVGLAAVAAYGKAESGFSPRNVNRIWNDPSESGQSGQAGGILSWRADRLQRLQSFAAQRGEQGNGSPETQAAFLAQEDPTLIPRLNAAKTPQEANQIMASAWRFAGYNREGGENARRLALTQQYAGRFGAGGGQASATVPLGSPPQPVQVAENEADVARIEAQMPGYGGAPVQVAQAGAPVADAPAPGAVPAQGFAVPGATPQQTQDIAADPKVQEARRRYMTAPTERTRAAAKADLDLAIEDAKRRSEGDKPTEQTRNYEAYRREEMAAGREPLSRLEFLKSQRTQITNNVGAGETEEEKARGKAAGTRAADTMSAAASASKQLMRLGQIDALMKNVETGRLSPSRMTIAALGKSLGVDDAYLEAIGLDPKRVGDAQALNAISGRMLVDMIGSGGFPANNFSNTDREFLTGTLPSLANDPRANKLLITAAKRMAELDIEKAKSWRAWKRDNPKGSFDDFELEFADRIGGTDQFADLVKEAQKLTGGGATPVAAPTQAAPSPSTTPAARPPGAQPRTAINPNTGQRRMETPDGQWVPIDG